MCAWSHGSKPSNWELCVLDDRSRVEELRADGLDAQLWATAFAAPLYISRTCRSLSSLLSTFHAADICRKRTI